MKFLIIFLLTCSSLFAEEFTFEWDPNPPSENVIGYNLYRMDWVTKVVYLMAVTSDTRVTVDIPPGQSYIGVTAYNSVTESDYDPNGLIYLVVAF